MSHFKQTDWEHAFEQTLLVHRHIASELQLRSPPTTGLEELALREAEELLRSAGFYEEIPDVEVARGNAFVVTQEALIGEADRPGLGFHVSKLFDWVPGLALRVVARDAETVVRISKVYGIPLDQVIFPQEGESYEEAVRRAARQYLVEDGKATYVIHTESSQARGYRQLGANPIYLPADRAEWLEAVALFFRFLGLLPPTQPLDLLHYDAADLAARILARRMA